MINIGQGSPGLVLPQISSAPSNIGTPQYVQSAQEGRGKQGQTFNPPQGPIGMQMYNGQSFPYFGVMQPNQPGVSQPPNQPTLPTQQPPQSAYQGALNNMNQQMPGQVLQQNALNNVASQIPSYMPQFNQQQQQMNPQFQPPPQTIAQPVTTQPAPAPGPMHPYNGNRGYVGDTGYTHGGWDMGNGRTPGRTYAR